MFIFLSYKIDSNTPIYGGKTSFLSNKETSIKNGDSANTQKWNMQNHLGTHIDFPYHFYENGQTSDFFPPEFWIINSEKIQVLEFNLIEKKYLIEPENFVKDEFNSDAQFLILKTGFGKYRSQEKFWKYNPGISVETTDWIIKNFKKIKIIGIDSISISSWQHREIGRKVHKKLLNPKNPILIIEDMDLTKINRDTIFKRVIIAPLIVSKSDGGPCTILAEVK